MSNYADLSFSDEEVIAIYLFGVMDKHREIKGIYEYADLEPQDQWLSTVVSRIRQPI